MPNQSDGDLLHTMASYGLSHVRTKLRHLPVIPFLTPHPIEADGELACHRHLGDRAVATHRQVQEVASPLGVEADDGLRRLHQQETEQSVTLLADMSQPLAIGWSSRREPAPGSCRSACRRGTAPE